jgi:hypothetical protein
MADGVTTRCGSCTGELAPGLRFCTECGAPVPAPAAAPAVAPTVVAPPPEPSVPTCRGCGTPTRPDLRFCVECGTPASTPSVPPPPAAPAMSAPAAPWAPAAPTGPERPRRGRLPIVLGVVAALALIGAAAVAGVVVLGGDDPATTATATDTARPSPSVDSEAASDPSATTEPAVEPSPSETTAAEPDAQCWDGTVADKVAYCSEPTGARGMRWVFPSIDDADCGPGGEAPARIRIWTCTDHLTNGTAIKFNYSQWRNVSDAIAHYDGDAYDKTDLPGGRTRWLSVTNDNTYKAAIMYDGMPWSVTVYAPNATARDRAVDNLLTMRPRDELRGNR